MAREYNSFLSYFRDDLYLTATWDYRIKKNLWNQFKYYAVIRDCAFLKTYITFTYFNITYLTARKNVGC